MSILRTGGVVVIVILLSMTLVGANLVTVADRTVLSGSFVKTTLAEENAYETAQDLVVEQATEQLGDNETVPVDIEGMITELISRGYLQNQTERNIDRVYGYLHGNRDEFLVAFNLTPIKDRLPELIAAEIENRSLAELAELADGGANQSVSVGNFSLSVRTVGEMADNQSQYQEARTSLREEIKAEVLDELVQESFESLSNDQLLALVIEDYDPRNYTESEKASLVEERESEIREELRSRIEQERGDEIDRRINARLQEQNELVKEEVESVFSDSELPEELESGVISLVSVGVDGLTTNMSYATYAAEFETAKAELANGVAALAEERVDEEVPDRLVLSDELSADDREQLSQARQAVGFIDILSFLLPLIALGLIGLIWLVTRSPVVTAIGAGIGLVLGAVPGLAISLVIPSRLKSVVADVDVPTEISELLLGFVDQLINTLLTQSVAMTILGIIAIGIAIVFYWRDRP